MYAKNNTRVTQVVNKFHIGDTYKDSPKGWAGISCGLSSVQLQKVVWVYHWIVSFCPWMGLSHMITTPILLGLKALHPISYPWLGKWDVKSSSFFISLDGIKLLPLPEISLSFELVPPTCLILDQINTTNKTYPIHNKCLWLHFIARLWSNITAKILTFGNKMQKLSLLWHQRMFMDSHFTSAMKVWPSISGKSALKANLIPDTLEQYKIIWCSWTSALAIQRRMNTGGTSDSIYD